MKKADRLKVYNKYDGHCAYCGREIEYKDMQRDHLFPQFLSELQSGLNNDHIDNLMPACRPCNTAKGGMRLEMWRDELALQVKRLRKNAQFDRALRFGQIEITESPIRFYFENIDKINNYRPFIL